MNKLLKTYNFSNFKITKGNGSYLYTSKNEKLLVLMVTHEPADAKKVASQTLVVKDKKVHPPLITEKALDPINGPLADYLLNQ